MIRFDNVTKHYRGAPRAALDAVTLEIGAGEFVFLVGASGSGKSTLLRLMLREERPSQGEIHVLGQRLTSISNRKVPYFRRSLGVVFQDFRLLPNKTVHDNVAFTLQVIGKSRGFIQTAVPDVLETVGLGDKAQNYPNELSGGEQQRVAIARAAVNKPAILLADEPTGNLDPRTSDGIMAVLERINLAGTTVVMATHDVTIVDRMQKRVVELTGGRIIRDELEATYVTSSIPLPRARAEQAAVRETGPEVPLWARGGGRAGGDAQPSADGRLPDAPRPRTAAWAITPPVVPPIADAPAAEAGDRAPEAPASASTRSATGAVRLPGATGPIRVHPAQPTTGPGAQPPTGSVRPVAGSVAGPQPRTGPLAAAQTGAVSAPGARPVTGPTATPPSAPIWARSDTSPVLLPGEHAPWRAAPVAPPAEEQRTDGRSLFFAAPVPAQRARTPDAEGDAPEDAAVPEAASAAVTPRTRPDGAVPLVPAPVVPSAVTRTAPAPADIEDTGDPEGLLLRLGRHRTPPLPDHLDFVTGLNLRTPRPDENDDVGPSS